MNAVGRHCDDAVRKEKFWRSLGLRRTNPDMAGQRFNGNGKLHIPDNRKLHTFAWPVGRSPQAVHREADADQTTLRKSGCRVTYPIAVHPTYAACVATVSRRPSESNTVSIWPMCER